MKRNQARTSNRPGFFLPAQRQPIALLGKDPALPSD
jgi:hypothetical protein